MISAFARAWQVLGRAEDLDSARRAALFVMDRLMRGDRLLATHRDGDGIRPCGRCEKCRRVVTMLVALGADPARCGYDRASVDRLIAELRTKGLHQEGPGVAHVEAILVEKGLLDPTGNDGVNYISREGGRPAELVVEYVK
mgnify:CR=1 FL=1